MKSVSATLSIAVLTVASATARNCSSTDLSGSYNTFRFTDDLGTYAPGSSQVVSYDHPFDSPITGITALDIVTSPEPCDGGGMNDTTKTPSIIAGVPVSFVDQTADQGGSVNLRLPVDLPAGKYSYRLTLSTATDTCHLHSSNFISDGQAFRQLLLRW